jgi:hypothetical protein
MQSRALLLSRLADILLLMINSPLGMERYFSFSFKKEQTEHRGSGKESQGLQGPPPSVLVIGMSGAR